MGGICVGGDKEPKHDETGSKKPKAVTSAGHEDWKESEWRSDMSTIWGQPIEKLPVHTDIPRLGAKIHVLIDGAPIELAVDFSQARKGDFVQALLMGLATALGEPTLAKTISDHFYDHVSRDGTGDMSQQLLSFLRDHLHDTHTRTNAVLRCCHQKLIFPPFYAVKKGGLHDLLPFKDLRGSWEINVHIESGGSDGAPKRVLVKHSKHQSPIADVRPPEAQTNEPEFDFQWEVYMLLSSDFTAIDKVGLNLLSIKVGSWVPEERAEQIRTWITDKFPKNDPAHVLAAVPIDASSSSSSSSTSSSFSESKSPELQQKSGSSSSSSSSAAPKAGSASGSASGSHSNSKSHSGSGSSSSSSSDSE